MKNTMNDNKKTNIVDGLSNEEIRNMSTPDLLIKIFEELHSIKKDNPRVYEVYKDDLKNLLIDKQLRDISITDHPSGRKGLTVESAMFHVKGEYIRQYFDATSDVIQHIMYNTVGKEQALASALELQGFVLGELYERSQSHNF